MIDRGFAYRWLLVAVAISGTFGLSMVVAPGPIEDFFNWMIFGDSATPAGFSDEAADYLRFVYGVLGAVMLGWMVLTAALVAGPVYRGEHWAWNAVTASILIWFAVDTAHSLATGYGENAAFNTVFLLAVGVPLAASKPARATRA